MFSSVICRVVVVAAFSLRRRGRIRPIRAAGAARGAGQDDPGPQTVSPELQQIIAQPLRTAWNTPPTTPEGWKQLAESLRASAAPNVEAMRQRLKVKVEPGTMAGVKIYAVTPETSPRKTASACWCRSTAAAMCSILPRPRCPRRCSSPRSAATRSSLSTTACRLSLLPRGARRFDGGLQGSDRQDRPQARRSHRHVGGRRVGARDGLARKQLGLPMPGAIASGRRCPTAPRPATPSTRTRC